MTSRPRAASRQRRGDDVGDTGPEAALVALLGKLPDAEVAQRTGRTRNAVTVKRNRLGIPTARDGRRRR